MTDPRINLRRNGAGQRGVSRETQERVDCFVGLLQRWNRRINLVTERDLGVIQSRHILDSLQLLPLIPTHVKSGIDLGSGAGFPGLLLALATQLPFYLIEADRRKAAFLREAGRVTGAPVTVHATRIERATLPPADLITARGLAPLPKLLGFAEPFLAPQAACLFPKGADVETELTQAAIGWQMRVERFPSRTSPRATVLRITELHRVAPAP